MVHLLTLLLSGPASAGPVLLASTVADAPETLVFEPEVDSFQIYTSRGRLLTAVDLAWAVGDREVYQHALRVRRRHRNLGGGLLSVGPILMIAGTVQLGPSSWRAGPYMEAVGGMSLLLGTTAIAGGVALLFDKRPVRPSTYYSADQAEQLVDAFNEARLYGGRARPHSELAPRRRELQLAAAPWVSPSGAGAVVIGLW